MQTFLPYRDFKKSAAVLDYKRLGKQRVETMQLLSSLTNLKYDVELEKVVTASQKGWKNHPASRMWKNYERALLEYQKAICLEWTSRGYKDNCLSRTEAIFEESSCDRKLVIPEWLTEELCSSHRAALLFKDEDFYSQFGWEEKPSYDYKWPVELKKNSS